MAFSTAAAIQRPTNPRLNRPCVDCTCSPGLLSRQGRRASVFLKQMSNNTRKSRSGRRNSNDSSIADTMSIYSSDSLCQSAKEVNTTGRLLALRKEMGKNELCCYIVPSEDEHQSEYVSLLDQRRQFISGFSGSAGIACITRDLLNFNDDAPEGKSILSTDGRYFNQASQELDFNWTLVRQGIDPLTWQRWCIREAKEMSLSLGGKPAKIGVDPKLISHEEVVNFQNLIKEELADVEKCQVELVAVPGNLVDNIWNQFETVPARVNNELLLLTHDSHGENFDSKRDRFLNCLTKKYQIEDLNSTSFIAVALDEICWFLNLRGSDIPFNPVFYSYLLINEKETILFTDNPFNSTISTYFETNNITVKPYNEIWSYLTASIESNSLKKFFIPDTASWQLINTVSKTSFKIIPSPINVYKSVKNSIEIANAHCAQVKDAQCLIQYFAWLEDKLVNHDALLDEYKAGEKLLQIRHTQKNFMGNSFETISSTGANAAVIHYSPPVEGSSMIDPSKIYLCDSGSQFLEGTTDITRTIHMTQPTKDEINNYTLVLKGNLALERLVFPEGTTGFHIDIIARQYLWSHGLDYRHGTGHGIGSFLNVHEGPIGVGIKPHLAQFPLQAGNIISNEPGYYKDDEYGIRIENDMVVKEAVGLEFGDKKFLKFENITLVPYCRKLINVKLLTKEEKEQLNSYNKRIWDSLVQMIQPQSITYKWLKRETANY
ncbi:hypothetical protein NCAS_0A02910 [Naumovozyma castellii]|uniref:Xaa-Pro aminopeptidase n=1 Tax=Naumovozyma castellii TaxID=27288 RepID=G0V5W1_NAUCA|nr:hypothetical protein NCAS_0A02910 [Naumovozyma castellii CBS 4309]CCC66849.1 hypothetical protein NCAS_0A02910 [Naumovozyma castellii CBS 4309]